jgi:hypothetical protein
VIPLFCGECGTQNPDTNQFCKNCGKSLRRQQQAPQPAPVPFQPVAEPVQPQPVNYPPQPAGVQPPVAATGVPAPVKPPLNKGMLALGIIGVIAGIASWFRYPYILAILAMVFAAVAIAKSEKKTGIVAIIGCIAILIGLSCIVVDLFYFTIFPTPPLDI